MELVLVGGVPLVAIPPPPFFKKQKNNTKRRRFSGMEPICASCGSGGDGEISPAVRGESTRPTSAAHLRDVNSGGAQLQINLSRKQTYGSGGAPRRVRLRSALLSSPPPCFRREIPAG